MGMARGTKWKRAAVVPKADPTQRGERISQHLEAYGIKIEWWTRKTRASRAPVAEHWVMVAIGDWPMASLLAGEIA